MPSADGRYVTWVDFRDYVGVFLSPVERETSDCEGRSWELPDLHFDRRQYERELDRAGADGASWTRP